MAYCSRCSRCSAVSSCYLNILIGSLRCHYDDGQRQRERHRLPLAKQQLFTSSTLFLDHFFADYDLRSNHVYIRRRISLIFSNLDIFLKNSPLGQFPYGIRQSERVVIIVQKFQWTRSCVTWRFRRRRCRHRGIVLKLSSRNFAVMVTWRHTSPLYSDKIINSHSREE